MRGQVSSADVLVSTVIFAFLLVFLISFWFVNMQQIANAAVKERLETAGISISDLLLKSPGYPEKWEQNPSSLQRAGLAVSSADQNVLSKVKVANFTALQYNQSKTLLGLDGNMQYYITIEDLDNNRLYQMGNPGMENATTVVSFVRHAILSEPRKTAKQVRMTVAIYESK
jgi:hypothetical protein